VHHQLLWCQEAFIATMDANESTEGDMYQAIMWDAYQLWVEEFDHQAALKRNLPRREREWRFRSGLARLRGRAADAQQCAR
jgi:hypothetical protein